MWNKFGWLFVEKAFQKYWTMLFLSKNGIRIGAKSMKSQNILLFSLTASMFRRVK